MHKETLRQHLHNPLLTQAIAQKREVDEIRKALRDAYSVLQKTGAGDSAQREVWEKIQEYSKVSRNYGNMIEDTWNVTWQVEAAIAKHLDACDDDVDALPECIG